MRDLGIDQNQMKEQGIVFAVRRVEADYIAPARFDDLLDVVTTVASKTAAARLVWINQRFCAGSAVVQGR